MHWCDRNNYDFDEALDATRATSTSNYALIVPDRRGDSSVPIQSATYDASNHTVTLTAAQALALEKADAVVVCGGLGPTQDDVTRELLLERGELLLRLRERVVDLG